MHYKVDGYIVRTENAAKPSIQASGYVVDLLKTLCPKSIALDFGCGKLRYSVHLARLTKRLTLVDSEIQLSRSQVVCGKTTTIREYAAAKLPAVRILNHLEFRDDRSRYDFVLCANVLSSIPHIRTRNSIARLLANRLSSRGRCLFICQYTNSYFCTQMADKSVRKYADGFIKGRPENASFYGLIKPGELQKIVVDAGMLIDRAWINDQSGYVIARQR